MEKDYEPLHLPRLSLYRISPSFRSIFRKGQLDILQMKGTSQEYSSDKNCVFQSNTIYEDSFNELPPEYLCALDLPLLFISSNPKITDKFPD